MEVKETMTEDLPGDPFDIEIRTAEARRIAAVVAIRNQLANIEETIETIHALMISAPQEAGWDKVRDAVNCLASTVDEMQEALDSIVQAGDGR